MNELFCVACKKNVIANLVRGDALFGRYSLYKDASFMCCPFCRNYAEFNPETQKPFSVIPDAGLRKAINYVQGKANLLIMQKVMDESAVWKEIGRRIADPSGSFVLRECRDIQIARNAYRAVCAMVKERIYHETF